MMASPEGYRFRRPIVFPAMIVLRSKRRDGYIKTGKRFCSIARFHASPETFLLCPKVKADWRGVCNIFLKIKTFARADCPFLHLLSRSDLVQGQLQKCATRNLLHGVRCDWQLGSAWRERACVAHRGQKHCHHSLTPQPGRAGPGDYAAELLKLV